MAEGTGTAEAARPSAPYFPRDPTEPHWRWHAARVGDVLVRAGDAQVRQWLAPLLDTFRLRFAAVNERLDAGETPTVTDHDWRAFFDLQEKIERHLCLDGNPVDGAVNHLLRRFGQVPVFGVVDSLVWKELLTSEQIKQGMRPISRSNERRVGRWRWDAATVRWRSSHVSAGADRELLEPRRSAGTRSRDAEQQETAMRMFNTLFVGLMILMLVLAAIASALLPN